MNKQNLLKKKLNLQPHSEGGFYRQIYKSDLILSKNILPSSFSGSRPAMTSIYYMLEGNDFSRFHRLKADELWHFYDGSPLAIYIINAKGELERHILGNDLQVGELPLVPVKKNQWFAAELIDKNSFILAGCTVAPGFDYDDFELADKVKLIEAYPQHREIIERLT